MTIAVETVDPIPALQAALSEAQRTRTEAEADLAALDRQVAETTTELLRLDQRVEDAPLKGSWLTRVRNSRRKLREEREDAVTDRHIFEGRVLQGRQREKEAAVALHHAVRQRAQEQGVEVAAEIRRRIHQLQDLFTKWSALAEADRRSCDILRSLDPNAMNRLPTFSWATATDGNMTEALRELVRQRIRAEEDLRRRMEAARTNR